MKHDQSITPKRSFAAIAGSMLLAICLALSLTPAFVGAGFAQEAESAPETLATTYTKADGVAGFYRWLGDTEAASIVTGSGAGPISGKYLAEAQTMRDSAQSPLSIESMRESLEIIRICNQLRAQHGLPALQIDTALMAQSQVCAAWASHYQDDAAVRSDPHGACREYNIGENLAWNFSGPQMAFQQWYDEEKQILDDALAANPDATVGDLTQDEEFHNKVGHYLNIIREGYRYTGAACCDGDGSFYAYNTFEQSFQYSSRGTTYTYDRFVSLFNEYYQSLGGEDITAPYTITDSATPGAVLTAPTSAHAGDLVTVTIESLEGYNAYGLLVLADGGTIEPTQAGPGTWTFTMPASDVTVAARVTRPDLGVTIVQPEHATLTINHATPKVGEPLFVTVDADEGWHAEAVRVTDSHGNAVSVTTTDGIEWDFVMPGTDVTITASIVAGDPEENPGEGTDEPGGDTPGGDPSDEDWPFPDCPSDEWFVSWGYIDYVTSTGIMTGIKDPATGAITGFDPFGNLTRGQVATILYRAANPSSIDTTDPAHYATSSVFPENDVPGGMYYTAAVNWCKANGVITGYTDGPNAGKFCPDSAVTREQLATMVYRYAERAGADMGFGNDAGFDSMPDRSEVTSFAVDPMRWCFGHDVITGFEDVDGTYLNPGDTATRAEAAKIFTVLLRDVISMDL